MKFYKELQHRLQKNPYMFSLVTTATIVSAVGTVYLVIKELYDLPILSFSTIYYVILVIFIFYFIFLAMGYRNLNKVGPLGKDFKYGDDGVLWHGSEKAIAFRVKTFLGLLEQVGDQLLETDRNKHFTNSGRESGRDFASQLGTQIYPTELKQDGPAFGELTLKARLELWSEYDSSTGWGMFEVQEKAKSLSIVIKHPKLFDGNGGKHFAYYLAGYSETVANAITKDFGCNWIFDNDLEIHDGVVEISLNSKKK